MCPIRVYLSPTQPLTPRKPPVARVTEFLIAPRDVNVHPFDLTFGPDGNLWFTEKDAHKIGRMTTSGRLTEFALPTGLRPYRIARGPDDNLWYTLELGATIGRVTPAGVITEFPAPRGRLQGIDIVAGPAGTCG